MAHTGHIQTIYNYNLPSWSRNQFSISVSVSASAEFTTRLGSIFPSHPEGPVSKKTPPSLQHGVFHQSDSLLAHIQLSSRQHLRQHVRFSFGRVDLHHRKLIFFYSLSKPMIPPLDVFGARVVGDIFRKMDDTLVIAVKLEFVLRNSQLSDELLHPNYFLADFRYSHILGFRD